MTRLILLLPLAALGGCIIYDNTGGKCHGCGWEDDTDSGAGGDADTDTDTDTTPVEAVWALAPNTGEIGSTFIASLTGGDGFDYGSVASVEVYGDVALLASESRDDEILLTFQIPADAAVGAADLLVVRTDGTADFLDDILGIVAVGSGDGSGGDGSGSGDTGSGSGSGAGSGSGDGSGSGSGGGSDTGSGCG